MPIFELRDGELSAFRRLRPGPELYEQEIEALVWDDLEAFTGEPLFPVARQAHIAGGGVPDIVALDSPARSWSSRSNATSIAVSSPNAWSTRAGRA
jgi:hypothetical protein